MIYLSARNLSKRFGKKDSPLFTGIDLDIRSGDIYCLLGANGSGKTTLLRLLVGLERPDSGTVEYFGAPLSAESKRRIGYLGDRLAGFPWLTACEFMELSLELAGFGKAERKKRLEYALWRGDLLGSRKKKLSELSRGMKRRLGLSELIARDPDLVILDEPLEGLDAGGLELFQSYLSESREKGKSVLFSTHLYMQVDGMATRAGVLLPEQRRLAEKDVRDKKTLGFALAQSRLEQSLLEGGKTA